MNIIFFAYGVPQGSVLGPLLFLIYTNDIINATNGFTKTRLFADDSNAFVSEKNPTELKISITKEITELFAWFNANKLTVNLSKICFTIYKTKRMKIPEYLNIKVDNIIIKRVKSAKYLGVILDEDLNWGNHIGEMNKSIIKTANSFKIIKHKVPDSTKPVLFQAYIFSKIQYDIEVYGKALPTIIKKVQTQQNRALKILFSKDYYTPTKLLHKELNILLINDIYKLYILKFVYKHQNNNLPNIFNHYFILNNNIHNHRTRQSNAIHIKQTSNKKGKDTIKYQGAVLWNSIPDAIRKAQTIKTFSKKIKKHLLSFY